MPALFAFIVACLFWVSPLYATAVTQKQGFRLFRFDRQDIPDLLAMRDTSSVVPYSDECEDVQILMRN
jgi:hypothetical protein